jgi:AmmeMemoRadiSam system protein B
MRAKSFGPMYTDSGVFLNAIRVERLAVKPSMRLSGITVPHHLIAADLIARGFWAASGQNIDRVILLSPDHFFAASRPFATTSREFNTIFGKLEPDMTVIDELLRDQVEFNESTLFAAEHGIGAVLPFVAYFFPRARIVPIVISVQSTPKDWDAAVSRLLPFVGSKTLIVQSTDFSHYLQAGIAAQRDQETLNVLSAARALGVTGLRQNLHMDSKGAQYIQMRLQAAIRASGPLVVANRNSMEYKRSSVSTTSYIVQLYGIPESMTHVPNYPDQDVRYFGGDIMLGRYMVRPFSEATVQKKVSQEIRIATQGHPMIVNLEGVLLSDPPSLVASGTHVMSTDLAGPILRSINVVAASLANNHSYDFGPVGLDETKAALRDLRITPLAHDEIVDLGPFRLLALNFIARPAIPGFPVAEVDHLEEICRRKVQPPLLAFVHWGVEFTHEPTATEYEIASQLFDCGVVGIIGTHSHQASIEIEAIHGAAQLLLFSLGNLLFDQNGKTSSGGILELRFFKQGTFSARLIPTRNFFDVARQELEKRTTKPH